jgi:hypothetical protein
MKSELPSQYRRHLEERELTRTNAGSGSSITMRGLSVGCVMCVAIALGAPYTTMLLRGTPMGFSSATPAAFFLLFLLLICQFLLRLCHRRWGLTRGELITVTVMMMVASAIPTRGVTGMLLPMITGIHYYASAENRWAQLLHPHMAEWTLVGDPTAVAGFYEGGLADIPWASWLPALLGWLAFYAAFYLTLVSLLAILRRQWVEHERLPFPLASVPLELFREAQHGSRLPVILQKPSMWVGFAVPMFVGSLQALQHYLPQVPTVALSTQWTISPGVVLRLGVNFLMLGFAYFINTSIAFSLWFFYLLNVVEKRLLGVMGITTTQANLGQWTEPLLGHQAMGALIVLVVSGLWVGRDHLTAVWQKAVGSDPSIDDSDEIMPYRSAVIGCSCGVVGMSVWLWQAGVPGWIAPLFVFAALVIFTGLTRAIAEGGLPTISPAMVPAGFVITSVGVPALGTAGLIATGHTLIWSGEMLVFMMAPLATGLRLGSEIIGNRRRLLWAIAAAMLITLAVSVWFTLHLAYKHGGVNLHGQYFGTFPKYPATLAIQQLSDPTDPSLEGGLWMLGGGAVMVLLMVARHHFIGWPLHPLGFAVAPGWTMGVLWSSILLAWLIKRLVLRFGGARSYERTKPFFLGLVMGQLVVAGVWLVIDSMTGTVGNVIPVFY